MILIALQMSVGYPRPVQIGYVLFLSLFLYKMKVH